MRHYRNYKTPTTVIEMYNMTKKLIACLTCPLGGRANEIRLNRISEALEQVPDKYYRVLSQLIDRRMNAYLTPNEDGFSASDMDQAILRASGC